MNVIERIGPSMSMEANRIDTYTEISGQEIRFVARSCCGWRWCFVSRASISYLPSLSLSFCVSFLFRRRTFQFSSGTLKTLCNTLIRPIYTSRYPPAPGIETHPNRRSQLFVHHPNFGIKKNPFKSSLESTRRMHQICATSSTLTR